MNGQRFLAANAIALITHTVVRQRSSLFRPNPWISSKSEHKCFKKARLSMASVSKEDGTQLISSMKSWHLEQEPESSGQSKIIHITFKYRGIPN